MTQWRGWLTMLAVWCLLWVVGCSDSALEDSVSEVQPGTEPTLVELGLRLAPQGFSVAGLSAAEMVQVARGSYLVNGASGGCACHTTAAGYLAGGPEFPLPFPDVRGFTSVFSRNLTPDPATGMQLTENEFIEAMRTGKDFTDSTAADPQQLLIMPWHIYRFMSRDDLKAIYAFLRRIPPVRNAIRETFKPPFPFPPVSLPPIGDGDAVNDPNNAQRGLLIPRFFSSGPAAGTFVTQFNTAVASLTPEERAKVGCGSYLVNAIADCNACHTAGVGGLIPMSVDVNTVAYLAGGVDIGSLFGPGPVFSRNLTPDPDSGLFLTEEQFIQAMRFGVDFRIPRGRSLRVEPHFPTKFHLTLDDLKAIYTYLRVIPAVPDQAQVSVSGTTGPIGLSLFFRNGQMAPITLVGDAPRYLQEIDIVATVPSSGDQGIQPLIQASELSSLDWTGVEIVEEDWRAAGDGTFIRQHFYRGARWMEKLSLFEVVPTDDTGNAVGPPLIANAGKDDRLNASDDGFIRRFVVRQIAFGCPSEGDCTEATFVVQGLVQWRDALNAAQGAGTIPATATRLELRWSEQPQVSRRVQVSHASPADFTYGYGLKPSIETVNPPGNGSYYVPGETVQFRVTLRDGSGNRLHPEGTLATYGQFLRGEVPSGLRYYNGFTLFSTLYYALKHREGLMAVALIGPTDKLKTAQSTVGLEQFGSSQANFATPGEDGYTSIFANIPPNPIVFGGNPADDDTPASDIVPITLPNDAFPGTYIATLKSRREWGGEALNRAVTLDIQVGTANPSTFVAKTGSCNTCHTDPSSLSKLLHGLSDRRACFSCHTALAFEPDAAIDIRVHEVHDRSDRFRSLADIHDCRTCHLTPPAGPARGLLGN